MGIAFRRGIGLVTEKLLDGEQVNTVLGEPCGKAVPQVVKPEIADAGLARSSSPLWFLRRPRLSF
jgi:hypothetical protein